MKLSIDITVDDLSTQEQIDHVREDVMKAVIEHMNPFRAGKTNTVRFFVWIDGNIAHGKFAHLSENG